MTRSHLADALITFALASASIAFAADRDKQFHYIVHPHAVVSIANEAGNITVIPAQGQQVLVAAHPSCEKAEVRSIQNGNRIQIRTRAVDSGKECRVDYDLQIPTDAAISIRSGSGPVSVDHLESDVAIESETARIDVRDIEGGHVNVRSVSGPVNLENVKKTFVDITSVAGDINLAGVSGPKVVVNTATGAIRYKGDFGTGGDYSLMNHSGLIEVTIPDRASVDIDARSLKGSVENDFPFQSKQRGNSAPLPGHGFSGTSNTGASSVRLSSFTGTIRVKKQ